MNTLLHRGLSSAAPVQLIDVDEYCTIEALEDGLTVTNFEGCTHYSINGKPWHSFNPEVATPAINAGETISFKGERGFRNSDQTSHVWINKKFNLRGTIMSLLQSTTNEITERYVFSWLFSGQPVVHVADDFLPATSLDSGCYYSMFRDCTELINAPRLPATDMWTDTYASMFKGCTSLVEAPELPATYYGYYAEMFAGCTSLKKAPKILATTGYFYGMFMGCTSLVEAPEIAGGQRLNNLSHMFDGCTSLTQAPDLSGLDFSANLKCEYMFAGCTSLVEAPELPATILSQRCYYSMFSRCTSLVEAPELPAAVLKTGCYGYMFYGCTSLKKAPALPAVDLADDCYAYMFYGCTSLESPPELPATDLISRCYQSMFQNCSSLAIAPDLLAPYLTFYCYQYMFAGCSKLNYIKMLGSESRISATSSQKPLLGWVRGVSTSGTFIKSAGVSIKAGENGIPEGWTVEEVAV